MKMLNKIDPKIAGLLEKERLRQENTLDLIASENHISDAGLEAIGSRATDKYSEGYPGRRYYPGSIYDDEIERTSQRRGLKLFGLNQNKWHVNVQSYSGSPANTAIFLALTKPGETIMGMKLSSGGHLTHGTKVSISGKVWNGVQYEVNQETGFLDYDAIEKLALEAKPKIIISGFTAYPRVIDFKKFYEIAKKVGAYHVVDMSHIAGLIAGGVHPSPFPYADVVMTTTHKTLRGPRGAVIFARKIPHASGQMISDLIDKAVFPGVQGGPHNNITAAKAVCFKEASTSAFKKYAKQIVKNAKALVDELKKFGFNLVTGGTDNHLMVVDVRNFGIDGMEAEKRLEEIGVIANRNTVPGDEKPFKPSGLRLGTPALTTRGMKEKEMKEIARIIFEALTKRRPIASLKREVQLICGKFRIAMGSL